MNTFEHYVNNLTKKQVRKISKYYICDCELISYITRYTNSKKRSKTIITLGHILYNCDGISSKKIKLMTNNIELKDYIIDFIYGDVKYVSSKKFKFKIILFILFIAIIISFICKNEVFPFLLIFIFIMIFITEIVFFKSITSPQKPFANLMMFLQFDTVLNDQNKIEICQFVLDNQ